MRLNIYIAPFLFIFICTLIKYVSTQDPEQTLNSRYLLYDVNPGEGFNLRRDVYMRMANLVKLLNKKEKWTLVLPPWGRMYHWKSSEIQQEKLPWSLFFDVASLKKHIPVVEFHEYLEIMGKPVIEEIFGLQRYAEGWGGEWTEKMDLRDCIDKHGFVQDKEGKWRWWFWGYEEVYGLNFRCMSIQMEYKSMVPFLLKNTTAKEVFLWRGEQVTHGSLSSWSPQYWTARRSMRFAKHLRDIGNEFREKYLDSNDEKDATEMEEDWRDMERSHGDAVGGPYLAVHLRRRDFLFGHKDDVPSIKGAASQIADLLKSQKLDTVFIATDAPKEEYEELKSHLSAYKVQRFTPSKQVLDMYKDGGVAIIDQWICTHARYFIGSSVSTFSFRIHEEREILGFTQSATYNRLCADDQTKPCEQPSKWDIKYDPQVKKKDEL